MSNNSPEIKLEVCKATRATAVNSLVTTLSELLNKDDPISEVALRDRWLNEMRKYSAIFPDGWYVPPPYGVDVLFGSDKEVTRVSPKSTRPEFFWPKEDIFLDREKGIVLFFASPVDRQTAMIGDFGLTVYFGKNPQIIEHLKTAYDVTKQIADHSRVGMRLKDVASFGYQLLQSRGVTSNLLSPTDPTGTNMGHTIPFSYEDMTPEEESIFVSAKEDWNKTKDMISKKRRFINTLEMFKIVLGAALTIEPRPQVSGKPEIPMAWYHTIVLFRQNGGKEILTNFDEVFKLVGMHYML